MIFTSRLLLVVSFLLFATPVLAQRDRDTYTGAGQSIEINGEVRLKETGGAAPDIQVRLERFSGGIIDQMPTDSRGRFRFGNLQRGYYKVIVNVPGYRPAQQDADLQVLFRAYMLFELTTDKSSDALNFLTTDVVDAKAPPKAREEFVRGRTALIKKNTDVAIQHFQKALLVYNEFFDAHLLMATAFMDKREWSQAESALQRALEIRTDDATVLIALGEVHWREKRYADAERLLQQGLKLDENSWHGNFTLARVYWDMGAIIKAAQPAGRTLQLKPDFAEAHLLAGNILLRLQQEQRALAEYEEYLRLAPKGEYAPQTRELTQKLRKATAEKDKTSKSN